MKAGRWRKTIWLGIGLFSLGQPVLADESPESVTIGSKSFTESVILGEMLRHLVQQTGTDASHQRQLGGTRVLVERLAQRGD